MSAGDVVVGVDIGTTSTKVLVVGTDGTEVAGHRVATSWTGRAGWSETSAESFVAAALRAVDGALTAAARVLGRTPQVAGLGVCGMGESGVLLGPDGSVRAPVVAWFDPRGGDVAAMVPTSTVPAGELVPVNACRWPASTSNRSAGWTGAPWAFHPVSVSGCNGSGGTSGVPMTTGNGSSSSGLRFSVPGTRSTRGRS